MALLLLLAFLAAALLAADLPGASAFSSSSLRLAASSSANAIEAIAAAESTSSSAAKKRVSILLCPAQFCVPDDYDVLFASIREAEKRLDNDIEIGTCKSCDLPRTEWIKVAKQLPTAEFLQARLPVQKTLGWYFEAMERGLVDILAEEGPGANICIIGHSIGGWVARAYLGGMAGSSTAIGRLAQERMSSFVTLGTPHVSPEEALVDQTRGLLKAVETTPSCSAHALAERGIEITCVGSSGLGANFISTDLEELVAASSYLPLLGRIGKDVTGDGIVPLDLAFLDENYSRRVVVESCSITGGKVRHAHVLPTPWNLLDGYAGSIALPEDFTWYGSEGIIDDWAQHIQ